MPTKKPEEKKKLMFMVFQVIDVRPDGEKEEYLLFGGVFVHANDLMEAAKKELLCSRTRARQFSAYGDYPLPPETARRIFRFAGEKKAEGERVYQLQGARKISEKDMKEVQMFLQAVGKDWAKKLDTTLKNEFHAFCFGFCERPPRKQTTSLERREERQKRLERYARIRKPEYCQRCFS